MQDSFWKISTNTKTEDKCRKVLNQVLTKLDCSDLNVKYEPHWESKDFSGSFNLTFDYDSKEQLMFEVIRCGQLIGYDWELNGSIENQTAAYSRRSSISGVDMAEWHIDIPDEWR
jgi:hypothetical protein